MCTSAAHAIRLRQTYGQLHLVNAREAANDKLVQEITRRGIDLDEGVVIYAQDRFYHGPVRRGAECLCCCLQV